MPAANTHTISCHRISMIAYLHDNLDILMDCENTSTRVHNWKMSLLELWPVIPWTSEYAPPTRTRHLRSCNLCHMNPDQLRSSTARQWMKMPAIHRRSVTSTFPSVLTNAAWTAAIASSLVSCETCAGACPWTDLVPAWSGQGYDTQDPLRT